MQCNARIGYACIECIKTVIPVQNSNDLWGPQTALEATSEAIFQLSGLYLLCNQSFTVYLLVKNPKILQEKMKNSTAWLLFASHKSKNAIRMFSSDTDFGRSSELYAGWLREESKGENI